MHISRIKRIDDFPDPSKKIVLHVTFQKQEALANEFDQAWKRKDSLAYRQTVVVAGILKNLQKEQKTFSAEAIEWALFDHWKGDEEKEPNDMKFTRLKKRLAAARN